MSTVLSFPVLIRSGRMPNTVLVAGATSFSVDAGTTVTPDELIARCEERMAACTHPRQVVVVDELPTTVTGTIARRELRG